MAESTPRIAVIAQARMGSSRLPGKVLKEVQGRSILGHLVHRVRRAKSRFEFIIATTTHPSDDAIEAHGRALGVHVYRGSEHDVLERYRGAAASLEADIVLRITGDCPLLDGAELDRVLGVFLSRWGGPRPWDYVTNQDGVVRQIPRGLDVEVFSRSALERAAREAQKPGEREHVTPFLYTEPGRFRTLVSHPPDMDLGHLRLTVDTPADLTLIESLMAILGADAGLDAIAELLARRPDLMALNAAISQRGVDSEEEQRRRRASGKLLLGRADSHATIGSGHVARLSSLLAAWVHLGGRARLIGAGLEGFWAQRLTSFGVEIEHGTPDGPTLLSRAVALGADAVAVDGYDFGESFIERVSDAVPTLAVDDLAAFHNHAQVVVNQNLGFDVSRYGPPDGRRLLVGAEMVLLRPEFWDMGPRPDEADSRIVLSFGGSDPAHLTAPIAEALLQAAGSSVEIIAVMGPGMDDADRGRLRSLDADPRLHLLREVPNMAALLRASRVALIAAGTTTWEALACGTVPMVIQVAPNQAVVARGLAALGAGVDLGWHEGCDAVECADKCLALLSDVNLLETMAARALALVDRRGVWRAIDALLDVIERPL